MTKWPRTLMYHGIVPRQKEHRCEDLKVLYQKDLYKQLKLIKSIFHVLHPEEYFEIVENRKQSKGVLITFDDGFDNIFKYALPIAEELKIPITVFCCTRNIRDQKWLWFSRLTSCQLRNSKGWKKIQEHYHDRSYNWIIKAVEAIGAVNRSGGSELEQLLFNGVSPEDLVRYSKSDFLTIGGHTVNHPRLSNEVLSYARMEIEDNKAYLEGILGKKIHYFAYPEGDYNEKTAQLVKEAGYQLGFAVSRNSSFKSPNLDQFHIPRIGIYKKGYSYLMAKTWLRKP